MSKIQRSAESRGSLDSTGPGNICHGIAKTHMVLSPSMKQDADGHVRGSVYISPQQLTQAVGVTHPDIINASEITVNGIHTNFNGTSAPMGVTFHYGQTKSNMSPLATNNRAIHVNGTVSGKCTGDDAAVHPMRAYHHISMNNNSAPSTIHLDANFETQKGIAVNAIARGTNWAGLELDEKKLASTCTQIGVGGTSRWLIPKTAASNGTQCALSKAFNANMTSSSFCGGRYAKSNVATATNTNMQECYVVPHADFVTTATSLNTLLKPLDSKISKGLTAKFESLEPVTLDSAYADKPTVTCSATFGRHTLDSIMNNELPSNVNKAYSTAAYAKPGEKSVVPQTEADMIETVMAMKMPTIAATTSVGMSAAVNTVVNGSDSADLHAALSKVVPTASASAAAPAEPVVAGSAAETIEAVLTDHN